MSLQVIIYRVRQFVDASLARVSLEHLREAEEILPLEAQGLFRRMGIPDQRHALNVMRSLRHDGCTEPDLMAAALLHDVGKSAARIYSWHRAIIVLSKHLAPRLLERLIGGEPRGWRRPFVIHDQHAGIGAEWAAQAGCSALTVSLIRRHQEPLSRAPLDQEEQLLVSLQRADSAN